MCRYNRYRAVHKNQEGCCGDESSLPERTKSVISPDSRIRKGLGIVTEQFTRTRKGVGTIYPAFRKEIRALFLRTPESVRVSVYKKTFSFPECLELILFNTKFVFR